MARITITHSRVGAVQMYTCTVQRTKPIVAIIVILLCMRLILLYRLYSLSILRMFFLIVILNYGTWLCLLVCSLYTRCMNKRTKCEPSQLVAAEGRCGSQCSQYISNAAQRACRSVWRDDAWRGDIGAAVQLVHNNNNKLIAQQGENWTKVKKFKKSFEEVL